MLSEKLSKDAKSINKSLWSFILTFVLGGCMTASAQPAGDGLEATPLGATSPTQAVLLTAAPTQVVVEPSQVVAAQPPGDPTPLPTTAAALQLAQLTLDGCCAGPFWSPDSQQVLFIDRPSHDAPAGLWGVGLQGGAPQFIDGRIGVFSPDMQLRAFPSGGNTYVERFATGERWTIPSGGRAVNFSPDGAWLAWNAGQAGPPFDSAQREVWVSRFDGSQARKLIGVVGGGFAAWFSDGRLLVSGRGGTEVDSQALWAVTLAESGEAQARLLVEINGSRRVRGVQLSPDGNWLVYMLSFSDDPALDGLWLLDTRGGEPRRLEVFGSYSWRDAGRLLVVPLELGQAHHRLLQIDAASGEVTTLGAKGGSTFKIANGDWSVSPDGRHIAFVSAYDQNIWLLTLP